jgi:hypothetical protein
LALPVIGPVVTEGSMEGVLGELIALLIGTSPYAGITRSGSYGRRHPFAKAKNPAPAVLSAH